MITNINYPGNLKEQLTESIKAKLNQILLWSAKIENNPKVNALQTAVNNLLKASQSSLQTSQTRSQVNLQQQQQQQQQPVWPNGKLLKTTNLPQTQSTNRYQQKDQQWSQQQLIPRNSLGNEPTTFSQPSPPQKFIPPQGVNSRMVISNQQGQNLQRLPGTGIISQQRFQQPPQQQFFTPTNTGPSQGTVYKSVPLQPNYGYNGNKVRV